MTTLRRRVSMCIFLLQSFATALSSQSHKQQQFCLTVFDLSNRTIIKASDSIEKGAKYLGAQHAASRKDCEVICCQTPTCNIAVFQQIKSNDCYLFDCGKIENFKCIFAVHDNYVAMGMMVDRADLEKTHIHEQAKHEMDLSLLKAKEEKDQPKIDRSDDRNRPPPQALESNMKYERRLEQTRPRDDQSINVDRDRNQYYDGNAGERDRYGNRGADDDGIAKNRRRQGALREPQSVMDKSVGKPQSPFEQKKARNPGGNYRSGCNMDYQWLCASGECIANYDVCDGIKQCRDGSDEDSSMCSKVLSRKRPELGPPPDSPRQPWNNRPPPSNRDDDYINGRNGDYGQWNRNQQYHSVGEGGNGPTKHNGRIIPGGNIKGGKQKNLNQQHTGQAATSKITVPDKETKIISVTKEKISVERIEKTGSTSLAALILGLGLSLLAIFLVYISCRLRKARKRLRRPGGKVMNAAEGEFLVNGMYL